MANAALVSNTAMEIHTAIEKRLMDLEIKTSFTEDLVDQLNQTIFRQQELIDVLLREVSQLRIQSPDGGSGSLRNLRDELPPHY